MSIIAHGPSIGKREGTKRIEKKKMGRPTDSPKSKPIHVRLDEDTNSILDRYCEQEGVSRAEGIRRGIKKLLDDIKN